MSARRVPRRRSTPPQLFSLPPSVASIRDDWLAQGLCAEPSDRDNAETAVAELFQMIHRRPPGFVWVPSPSAGAEIVAAEPFCESSHDGPASAIADLVTGSRHAIADRIARRWRQFPQRPSTYDVVWSAVVQPLRTTLIDGVAVAIRKQVGPMPGRVTWYGQQEAHHLAEFGALSELGLVHLSPWERRILDLQERLARSTGWWWVTGDACVMSERPTAIYTELSPNAEHGQRRLHHPDQPAIQFADGANTFVLHGTIVPDWVICDPTVERISTERSVEIRRCAIEHIGWERFIDSARLRLVDRVDDPGNSGHPLSLYATPDHWAGGGRILLATNGSAERDGTRRRYGLTVPSHFTSALDAAGWTYGLRGRDYARLARRT